MAQYSDIDLPLVSLCMTSFNQRDFIADALRSALDQTYSNLEIVICDDHSTDGTEKIIEDCLSRYNAYGRRILYKYNEMNLGVSANYMQCFKLANGRLLVTGSGDDISHPDRVEHIVRIWKETGCNAKLISHGATCINSQGERLSYSIGQRDITSTLGALTTYDKSVIDSVDHLPDGCYEDAILPHIAAMIGKTIYVGDQLLDYRMGGYSTQYNFDIRITQARSARSEAIANKYLVEHFLNWKDNLSDDRLEEFRARYLTRYELNAHRMMLLTGKTFRERLVGFRYVHTSHWLSPLFFQQCAFLLPDRCCKAVLWLYAKMRSLMKYVRR